MKFINKGIDDLGRYMSDDLSVLIKDAGSLAELEQISVGPYQTGLR
jgi:hypothetical protein